MNREAINKHQRRRLGGGAHKVKVEVEIGG